MKRVHFSLVQFNHSVMCDSLEPHRMQHARLPYPLPTPGACSNSHPSSQWCHPTSVIHLFLPSIFPSIRVFFRESGLHISWPQYWNFSFSISHSNECSGLISFRIDWLVCHPCCLDSQESSPTSQFESLHSSTLRLLYAPTLTSIHDYWKNWSFEYVDLCWQSDISYAV